MDSVNQTSAPSREAIASVSKHYSAITDTFPDAESNFERKWVAWIAVCLAQAGGGAEMDPCVEAEEFEIVKRLGPKIIPFVVFKLAKYDEENYLYGVFLCESTVPTRFSPDPPRRSP